MHMAIAQDLVQIEKAYQLLKLRFPQDRALLVISEKVQLLFFFLIMCHKVTTSLCLVALVFAFKQHVVYHVLIFVYSLFEISMGGGG